MCSALYPHEHSPPPSPGTASDAFRCISPPLSRVTLSVVGVGVWAWVGVGVGVSVGVGV